MKADIRQYIDEKDNGSCCWAGCDSHGEHLAPKSPSNLRERYNFCLEHVRKYNKSWNYFANMNDSDVQSFMKDSITGHRPTSKMGSGFKNYNSDDLREKVYREFNFKYESVSVESDLPDEIKRNLNILGLKMPTTISDIKIKYKELAKRYHPDINKDSCQERLKLINEAYNYLKKSDYF